MSEDSAYIAGYFDGEGCVCIHRDMYPRHRAKNILYRLDCNITSTDVDPLLFVQKKYGGTIQKRSMRKNTNYAQYSWQLRGKRCKDFMLDILPYAKIKGPQLEAAVEFLEKCCHKNYYELPEWLLKLREEYWAKLKHLKTIKKEL